jgi:hypothetical protein
MDIELGIAVYNKEELGWLDVGLENIIGKTKHNLNTTLYLSHATDSFLESCMELSDKYNLNFEPRGDNSFIHYYDEVKHRAFDIKKLKFAMVIQPDIIFTNKSSFDECIEQSLPFLETKYQINVSTDDPNDILPLGIQIFTRKMWEDIGCGDINYYPGPGSEYDEYRRCCIAWDSNILNDQEKYNKYLDGKHTPDYIHRIYNKNMIHVGKYRGNISDGYPEDWRLFRKGKEYTNLVISDCLGFYGNHFLEYHFRKWGGIFKEEKYIHPFNNNNNGVKIEWDKSLDPYPESEYISLRGLVL